MVPSKPQRRHRKCSRHAQSDLFLVQFKICASWIRESLAIALKYRAGIRRDPHFQRVLGRQASDPFCVLDVQVPPAARAAAETQAEPRSPVRAAFLTAFGALARLAQGTPPNAGSTSGSSSLAAAAAAAAAKAADASALHQVDALPSQDSPSDKAEAAGPSEAAIMPAQDVATTSGAGAQHTVAVFADGDSTAGGAAAATAGGNSAAPANEAASIQALSSMLHDATECVGSGSESGSSPVSLATNAALGADEAATVQPASARAGSPAQRAGHVAVPDDSSVGEPCILLPSAKVGFLPCMQSCTTVTVAKLLLNSDLEWIPCSCCSDASAVVPHLCGGCLGRALTKCKQRGAAHEVGCHPTPQGIFVSRTGAALQDQFGACTFCL